MATVSAGPGLGADAPGVQAAREAPRQGWLSKPWRYCAAVFIGTRLAVVAGAAWALSIHRPPPPIPFRIPVAPSNVQRLAERMDGFWYLHVARAGYGHSLHPALPPPRGLFSPWAFYPGWPLLIRGVHTVAPLSYDLDALVLASLIGFGALCAFYAMARGYADDRTARIATLLLAAWPASGLLDLPYSEGLFIAAAAIALLALRRQQWWIAGLAGAVATGTRPTGFAVIAAALVAAVIEFRRSKRIVPFVAPALAVCGVAAFVLYGWHQTGDPLVWRHAEALWNQRLNGDSTLPKDWIHGLDKGGFDAWRSAVEMLGAVFLVAGIAMAVRYWRRLDPVLLAYVLVALVMMLGYSGVGPRPRFVLELLPGFLWTAQWLRRRTALVLASLWTALLVPVTLLYLYAVVP